MLSVKYESLVIALMLVENISHEPLHTLFCYLNVDQALDLK